MQEQLLNKVSMSDGGDDDLSTSGVGAGKAGMNGSMPVLSKQLNCTEREKLTAGKRMARLQSSLPSGLIHPEHSCVCQ